MCEHFGIMYLSSMLKNAGYITDLVQTDVENYSNKIRKFSPDILAYTSTTGEHRHLIKINQTIKKEFPHLISIFGGPHPTFFPEMIEEEGVDAVFRGEGEFSILEFVKALEKKKSIRHIKGVWVKENGKIYKNSMRSLVKDLNVLPFPDRELIYNHDKNLKEFGEKRILIGRGCPFRCTYCFNNRFSKLYGHEWDKVRKRSVENVLQELKELKARYKVEFIRIVDDTFIMCRKEWLKEFAEEFKKEIGVPFFCNVRANLVTPETVELLKKAGCYSVFMAVETGNEKVRNELLKRNMSNRQLFEACRLLREAGIKYGFYNMLGLPVENPYAVDMETLKLNIKLKPTMAWSSIFTPFPRTELGQYCIKNGYFNGDFDKIDSNPKIRSALEFRNEKEKNKVENLHKLFGIAAEYPKLVMPFINCLVKLPPNKVYNCIHMGLYGWNLKAKMSTIKITPFSFLKWARVAAKHTKSN